MTWLDRTAGSDPLEGYSRVAAPWQRGSFRTAEYRIGVLESFRNHTEVLWGFLLALVIVVLLTPVVGNVARYLGVVDKPGGRRVHERIVPKLGGLALFFGILIPSLAFLHFSPEMRGLILGATVATAVGAIDDFRGLRWWEKLGGQVGAAVIPVASGSGSTTSRSRSSASTSCRRGSASR